MKLSFLNQLPPPEEAKSNFQTIHRTRQDQDIGVANQRFEVRLRVNFIASHDLPYHQTLGKSSRYRSYTPASLHGGSKNVQRN